MKNAVVVCLGIVLLSEHVSVLQAVGYAVSIAAFFWYQSIKAAQISGSSPPPDAPQQGARDGQDSHHLLPPGSAAHARKASPPDDDRHVV